MEVVRFGTPNDFERYIGCVLEFDGLILSPTREKLEPTIPRKDDDSRGSQKNSPKKGSPQKLTMLKKGTQKSKSALRTGTNSLVFFVCDY